MLTLNHPEVSKINLNRNVSQQYIIRKKISKLVKHLEELMSSVKLEELAPTEDDGGTERKVQGTENLSRKKRTKTGQNRSLQLHWDENNY